MASALVQAERVFARAQNRRADAEQWLGELLHVWDVRSASTGRWLAAAKDTLDSRDELLLSVQYDPIFLLLTLEIRRAGEVVYGIDDLLG